MINKFDIQNFRGVQAFHVTDLGLVNLLLGYNNCGKSSVLDALFLFSGVTNPRLSISVNWPRHYMSSLVDEIDNGLHYKSMPILWKSVLRGADKYNVQVFATTHNIYSLKAVNRILQEESFQSMQTRSRVFTLRKTSYRLTAIKSTYLQFRLLINEEIEIR